MKPKINNIEIPIEINDRFIAPDLEDVCNFYPEFCKINKDNKREYLFNDYLLKIIKQIINEKVNGYESSQKLLDEFVKYIGLPGFEQYKLDFKNIELDIIERGNWKIVAVEKDRKAAL